ncbi:hypothetical protein EDC01DRAFT_790657 [Geopyxis carbonaria]|nr:hypothetical protein EDC01DRAFT_790657 [Geopyxis carbonaria]
MSNDYVHRHSHFVADKEDDLSSSSNDYVPDPMDLDIDDNNQAPVDTSNSEKAQADLRKAWDSQDLANRGSQTAAVHRRFSDLNPRKLNRMNRAVNRLKSRYNGSPNRFNNNKKLTFRCRTECEPVAWTVGLRTPNATRIPLALLSTRFLIPRTWASVHKLTNVGFFAPCDPPVGEPNTDQSYFKPHVPAACAHCGDDELLGTGICFSCARRRGVELLGPGAGFLLKGLVATFFWKDPEK